MKKERELQFKKRFVILNAKFTKNKGQIMKAVMGELKGKADGKVINQVVAELTK